MQPLDHSDKSLLEAKKMNQRSWWARYVVRKLACAVLITNLSCLVGGLSICFLLAVDKPFCVAVVRTMHTHSLHTDQGFAISGILATIILLWLIGLLLPTRSEQAHLETLKLSR